MAGPWNCLPYYYWTFFVTMAGFWYCLQCYQWTLLLLRMDPGIVCKVIKGHYCYYGCMDPGITMAGSWYCLQCYPGTILLLQYGWILVLSARLPGDNIFTMAGSWHCLQGYQMTFLLLRLDSGIFCYTTAGHLILLWLYPGVVCNATMGHCLQHYIL